MKKLLPVLAAVLLVPTLALAGEVYGKILEGTTSVGEAATVEAKCGGQAYSPAKTDKTGNYHLVLEQTGKCTLTVKYKGQSASLEVASYDEPAQVDLILEIKDGKLAVRRK